MCKPGIKDDVDDVKMSSNSNKSDEINENDYLHGRIVTLRHVFQAVDFDASLWDSLFAKDTVLTRKVAVIATAAAVANKVKRRSQKKHRSSARTGTDTDVCTGTVTSIVSNASTTASTTQKLVSTTPDADVSPYYTSMTLSFVLNFLEISMDDSDNDGKAVNSIPEEYLNTAPAYRGLEDFCLHHPHLHDSLLQCITMGLSNEICTSYFAYIQESSQSVEELQTLLDGAIRLITQHNLREMQLALGTPLPEPTTPLRSGGGNGTKGASLLRHEEMWPERHHDQEYVMPNNNCRSPVGRASME